MKLSTNTPPLQSQILAHDPAYAAWTFQILTKANLEYSHLLNKRAGPIKTAGAQFFKILINGQG